ncbi:uncharacterized protein TNCT_573621 [Trichonephila clavata]|uniref:Uncharacterized protein n=1 Tax=Trichonephila clavata TaxID=2740835 RepID=A0A8X6LW99_TRICU|nr:uncharacterized protein TNCT_573621 [Trichonephila clavata]
MDGCREVRPCAHSQWLSSPRRQRSRPRNSSSNCDTPWWKAWMKKYVIACLVCGGLSISHGIVFIVIYLLLRSYTSSLQFFETIPTYVPGVVFIITGLILMCFAKRRNRYTFLLKMTGGCCLVCALLCVVITVTTTVVHMNRLQTLHECVYTPQSKTCMCVSAIGDHNAQEAHRFVFNNTPNCEVVHGSLYSCLRALFSFSVLGILLCIASSMLVYQLLSHEKKRLYWEQLELRRRFLYQRHSHHSVCGCYDELYPWQLWEMLDYRFLAAHNNMANNGNEEEECPPPNITPNNDRNSGHRPSGWNWLPWPRHHTERRLASPRDNRERLDTDTPSRQNFMSRLMSRDSWNQQAMNMSNTLEDPCSLSDSVGSLPWRSECIHIFRPSPRNSNCFPPMRFGIRSRSSPYGRPHSGGNHRRTRSNDGVFHHLHMNNTPRYTQPYSLVDANGGIACHFTGCEIPRYMWGPPPPYSQPQSVENITLYTETQNRRSALGIEQLSSGMEITRCNQVISALEIDQGGNGSMSSKMSTPLSERRFVCHNFSSDGITLTIGGNYANLCTQDDVPPEHKKEDTCIVEVHVPYILHKKDMVFNTLPARSCRRKDNNPFKSLSNIPLGLSRKINSLKTERSDPGQLSVIKASCDFQEINNQLTRVTEEESMNRSSHGLKSLSSQLLCDGPSQNMSLDADPSPSSLTYQPTMVEVPSEFKSSLVIPTTPIVENVTLNSKVYAQSLPNLNAPNSHLVRHIRSVPSSGNSSTFQDFGDFDLEDDSSPLVLCSPVSDIPSLPPLSDDDASDSSSSYPQYPRVFTCDHEAAFSNDSSSVSYAETGHNSDSSSCGVVVIGSCDLKGHSKTTCCRSNDTTVVPLSSSPAIIISKRPPTDCPINCSIRHLHHYHPDKIEVRSDHGADRDFNLPQDRTNNFVVTIKSVNV